MASADEYAAWIVKNSDKLGTPDFDVVAKAYQEAKGGYVSPQIANDPISQGAKNFAADMPMGQQFLVGVGRGMTNVARGAGQRLGLSAAPTSEEVAQQRKQDAPLMGTGAGVAGDITGNVAATLPSILIPGAGTMTGAAALGAALGAAQPTTEGESVTGNALTGAAGGAAGQFGANLLGRALRPVQSSLSHPLSDLAAKAESTYGIPLTAAQRTGSRPLAIIDAVLENMPLTADKQALAKAAQRQAYNKAVLGTVGETADHATPDVLNAARTRIGDQFNQLSDRNTVSLGNDFLDALSKIEGSLNPFSKPGIRDAVDKGLDLAASGNLDGRIYQNVRSTLGKQANDAFKTGNSELGQALKTIKGALDDAATSSVVPADRAAWDVARKQWQALKSVEKAAAPTSADAVAGNVSPAKLAQALMTGNKQSVLYGTGDQTLPDLARIGQAFVKDQIPNSGTAQRSMYQRMIQNPIAGLWELGSGGVGVPLQAAINSRTGQRYLGQGTPSAKAIALAHALRSGATMTGAALPLSLNAQ